MEKTKHMSNHGILVGCYQASPAGGMIEWVSIKRAAGAHKIASHMRSLGWDIEVLDWWLAFEEDEWEEFIDSRITDDTVFLGISPTFTYWGTFEEKANKYIKYVRDNYPHVAIIGGGKAYSVTKNLEVDYHVFGYGEHGIIELCKKLMGKESKVVINDLPDGAKVVNCDTYHPCYPEKFLAVKYEDRDFLQPCEHLTLEWSRGCKFKCKFCSYNVIGVRGDYTRDMPSLYAELMENYDRFGVQDYLIADETINDTTEKLKAVSEQIQKLPFLPNFTGYVRGDLLALREDDKKYMAEMGLWGHFYGIETFNKKAGKHIGKGADPDKVKHGLLDVKKYFQENGWKRYRSTTSCIIGLPHDTLESLRENYDWHKEYMPDEAFVSQPLVLKNDDMGSWSENNTLSEFDRTWRTSGDFSKEELSLEQDSSVLPEFMREKVYSHYQNPLFVRWQHDTMNYWQANVFWAEVMLKYMRGRGVMNWYLHNFITPGTFSYEEALNLKTDQVEDSLVYEDTKKFFEEYKWKKLSL
jgi:radical SAM superfamily enzyme YgiQ (UPF0313 family)